MTRYTFNTKPNSYFRGRDVRVSNGSDSVLINLKDNMWAVNVKAELVRHTMPADVQIALYALPDAVAEACEQRAQENWWDDAKLLAAENGFNTIYSAGRSSGWMAVDGTQDWDPECLFDLGQDAVRFLTLAFEATGAIGAAEQDFYSQIREAMQELQIELSEYADWVGAEVRALDGDLMEVCKLDVIQGRAALCGPGDFGFSFCTESKLVRKADGNVPHRLTADPIMEQVFLILEARGELTREQIADFLEDEEGNEPARLYEDYIGPAINELERRILPSEQVAIRRVNREADDAR